MASGHAEAHHVDDFEQLLDRVETLNQEYVEPMQQAEVSKIATSAWGYTERGENRFGRHGVWFPTDEANELIKTALDDFVLLAYLRANNGPDSTFMVANGLAESLGWTRKRLADARCSLIRRGLHLAAPRGQPTHRACDVPLEGQRERKKVLVEDR